MDVYKLYPYYLGTFLKDLCYMQCGQFQVTWINKMVDNEKRAWNNEAVDQEKYCCRQLC